LLKGKEELVERLLRICAEASVIIFSWRGWGGGGRGGGERV
jgi:hypothetical protein